MAELSTLHHRIAELGSAKGSGRTRVRELLADGLLDAPAALMREIEETLLPRLLTFQSNRLERLTLLVANGRVLRLTTPISAHLKETCTTVLDADLASPDDMQKSELRAVLVDFVKDVTQLTVRPSVPQTLTDASNIGMTLTKAFFDAPEVSATKPQAYVRLEEFSEKISRLSSAFVRIDRDQVTVCQGLQPFRDRLLELAKDELSSRAGPEPDPSEQSHFVLMNAGRAVDQAAICAAISESVLFATFPAAQANDVLRVWQTCRS